MNRDELIQQVKVIYQNLASDENSQHFSQIDMGATPDAYYEKMLDSVINEINRGTFDNFESGQEIVNAVANDKEKWLSNWDR